MLGFALILGFVGSVSSFGFCVLLLGLCLDVCCISCGVVILCFWGFMM